MEMPKVKVFIEIDEKSNIIKIFSNVFGEPTESSILIDEGFGDKYAHAHLYLDKPIFDINGIAQYKYIDNKIREKTQEEIQTEIDALIKSTPIPTLEERQTALERAFLEMAGEFYNG